jgi:hypothetical protein
MSTKNGDILKKMKSAAEAKIGEMQRLAEILGEALADYRKPDADPYAELKKAHKEGRVIQFNYGQAIADWCDMEMEPTWVDPVKRYRIKPTPVMVPLGPEDVKCGDEIKAIGYTLRRGIVFVDEHKVGTFNAIYSFEDLKSSYEISRDGKPWQRCEKEAK